jgi:hemolysin D
MKLTILMSAWREMFGRYFDKWRLAWAHRKELERPHRLPDEAEFLPASLAVQDTPSSPMLGLGMRAMASFFVLALIAATLFHMDIVVVGQGVLIPSGHVKTIQSLESGVVRRIAVTEGQKVREGDVLLELYSPGISTDSARFGAEQAMLISEIKSMDQFQNLILNRSNLSQDLLREGVPKELQLLAAKYREYLDKKARADAEVARRTAEINSARESLAKVLESIPRLAEKAQDYESLLADGYVSRHSVLDQIQTLADARADALILKNRIVEIQASLQEATQARASLVSEMRRQTLEQKRELETRLSSVKQEYEKYKGRDDLMVIRSPIDGEVSHLMTYTVGGVIPAAQTVMSIVPSGADLEVEAVIENKDVGHVQPGMATQIKLETFPFAEYGFLTGEVRRMTANAINDDKKGLIYKALIALPSVSMRTDSFPHPLKAGMNASVEIKVGKRRVIEYLLSPMITSVREAARER